MAKTAAERAREYRARKRAAKEQTALKPAPTAPKPGGPAGTGTVLENCPTTMRDAVDASLTHMKWIKESDAASVAQAKMLAEDVDLFRFIGEYQKALSAHGRLSRVLNDLGGTPTVRMLRELRSSRTPRDTENPDGSNDSGKAAPSSAGGVVTKFERPKKRAR